MSHLQRTLIQNTGAEFMFFIRRSESGSASVRDWVGYTWYLLRPMEALLQSPIQNDFYDQARLPCSSVCVFVFKMIGGDLESKLDGEILYHEVDICEAFPWTTCAWSTLLSLARLSIGYSIYFRESFFLVPAVERAVCVYVLCTSM